jgi:hypothetical protein
MREMETGKACEREHDFTLVLTGVTELTPAVEDALFEAGCDDATLSLRFGRAFLTFSRTAPALKDAILSAIRDVRQAGIGADVLRVDTCDLVTQADIARRIGRSRQLVHQFLTGERGPGGFPPPVCHISDDSPLWLWCEVAYWLRQNDMIKEDVLRDAEEVAVINNALDLEHQRRRNPQLTQEVLQSVGSR